MDLVADIKQRLSIEDLVGQYVTLRKSGRNYKALCPFHNEKTPSFYISLDKQIAYCFGCQKGGDVFQFYQEAEGADFPTALKALAEKSLNCISPMGFKPSAAIPTRAPTIAFSAMGVLMNLLHSSNGAL